MMKELREYLLNLARRNDITVSNVETKDDGPDMAKPFLSMIIMNPNSSTQYAYEFRLAHELAHLLYGDTESDAVYNFSPYIMRVSERAANVQAIRMIASFWFDDVPVESRNWLDFMNYLGLQSHFEDMAREAVMQA